MRFSPGIRDVEGYPFEELDRRKMEALDAGRKLIDFGVGDPRDVTPSFIREALKEAVEPVSSYPRAAGIPELREAIAGWVDRRFGVSLDPSSDVIPTLGSKEPIFSMAQALLDPAGGRDLVVVTAPGYTIPERGSLFAGGRVLRLPLTEQRGFLPDLDHVDGATWERTAILWINYPNNPTGAVATPAFLEHAVALARRHDFLLASDEAYSEVWFDDGPPPSVLQVGDLTNVIAINTLSKRSSMTGYRSGFVAGDARVIRGDEVAAPIGRSDAARVRAACIRCGLGRRTSRRGTASPVRREAQSVPRALPLQGPRDRGQRRHLLPLGEGAGGPSLRRMGLRASRPRDRRGSRVVLRPGGRGVRADGDGADDRRLPSRGGDPRGSVDRPSGDRMTARADLEARIRASFATPEREPDVDAVEEAIDLLDRGEVRVAEPTDEGWVVNEWAKEAVLLYFRVRGLTTTDVGPFEYHDKLPLKRGYEAAGVRVVPPATARRGAFLSPGVILMPSYVNIGAWVGPGTMVDTWATVGSCAQIGADVHLSGGVGIGGVLEPLQAAPVIVEDGAFIGSRVVLVEGVRVGRDAVVAPGVVLTGSVPVIDVTGADPVEHRGVVPPRAIVVPGSRPREFAAGIYGLPCGLIIGYRDAGTDTKVMLNDILREFGLPQGAEE